MAETHPKTILLLEDDSDTLDMLATALSMFCGRQSLKARSFEELLGSADRALGCELALLDVNLGPDRPSGLDAYKWLRAHAFRGRICFLTGHARSHPFVTRALALGDAELLEKPIPIERLRKLIDGDER